MEVLSTKGLDVKFFSLIDEIRPDLFLEVGAFDAQTSVKVKNKLPNCSTYAYEASLYNFDMFKTEVKKSGVIYENLAISNYQGDTTFYVQLTNNGRIMPKTKKNNSILERTEKNVQYEHLTVNVNTLDNMFADQQHNNIAMWIDVEGVGYEVLLGAEKVLQKTKLIKIEVESFQFWKNQIKDQPIIEFLTKNGFTAAYKDQERQNQYNIIFIRDDG